MVSFLNRYFTAMVNVIKKHGGTIDKFIGDAIMALFGAPVSYEDNSRAPSPPPTRCAKSSPQSRGAT